MSFIKFVVLTLAGALNPVKSDAPVTEISTGKDTRAKVVMEGYIGAGRVKNETTGEWTPSAFGRLRARAALTGEGAKKRYVIEVDGGIRGVLFKNDKKKADTDPDYTGNLENGDLEYPLFARTVKPQAGSPFLSLTSGEGVPRKASSGTSAHAAPAAATHSDEIIPF